jgi:hypothetical protein
MSVRTTRYYSCNCAARMNECISSSRRSCFGTDKICGVLLTSVSYYIVRKWYNEDGTESTGSKFKC